MMTERPLMRYPYYQGCPSASHFHLPFVKFKANNTFMEASDLLRQHAKTDTIEAKSYRMKDQLVKP